jgi:hypothetical protein
MIFVMKFQAAAMSRANIPEEQRVDFSLYVDEFQNFSTDSFATIMSEARKYHLNLIVANQFTTQLTEEIRDAVFGNMGTIISFRVGQNDVDMLSKYFQPAFGADDLLRVPNYNTIVRTLVNGVPTQPFSMATLPPLGKSNGRLSAALKQLSAAKYGKPRSKVEAEIFERMKTIAPPPSAMRPNASPWSAPSPGATSAASSPAAVATPPQPQNSFLDEWLSKRKVKSVPKPAGSHPKPAPAPISKPSTPAAQAAVPKPSAPKPSHQPAPHPAGEPGSTHKVIQPLHDLRKPLEKKNISSEALESQEIDRIAEQLKKDLETKQSKAETPPQAEQAVIKPTEPHAEEVAKPDELELKLPKAKKPMPTDHPEESDTILIDKEGNVTFRQTEE